MMVNAAFNYSMYKVLSQGVLLSLEIYKGNSHKGYPTHLMRGSSHRKAICCN